MCCSYTVCCPLGKCLLVCCYKYGRCNLMLSAQIYLNNAGCCKKLDSSTLLCWGLCSFSEATRCCNESKRHYHFFFLRIVFSYLKSKHKFINIKQQTSYFLYLVNLLYTLCLAGLWGTPKGFLAQGSFPAQIQQPAIDFHVLYISEYTVQYHHYTQIFTRIMRQSP